MRYLITIKENGRYSTFLTNWFETENNYVKGMIVYDLLNYTFTGDGVTWNEIELDHL